MPYMHITTNVTVDEHTAELMKKQMGHAIEAIRGKSEQWLAVRVEGDAALWFAGTDEPAAVVQTGPPPVPLLPVPRNAACAAG